MSVVIVTRCFVTRSLIRDSGAEVVTGPGWETQSRGTETASVNQENVNFEINTWTLRFTSSWIWVKKESEPVLMFSLHDDVMVMLVRPWPDVMMTVSPFRHLVVTNKSYKNPQLIRSDSVQNSFFSPSWPIVLGLIYSDVTDCACGNWLKKVRELFQKLFAVNWRWYP